jgi:glycogen operon protein
LQAGDEFGRTQLGNNNAYAQDNAISWVDWALFEANAPLREFWELLTRVRREHAELRRETFLKGSVSRAGAKDVAWIHARGGEMLHTDWLDANLRTLGVWLGRGNQTAGRLLVLLNADHLDHRFVLPAPPPTTIWVCRFDTADERPAQSRAVAQDYPLAARSVVLLEC